MNLLLAAHGGGSDPLSTVLAWIIAACILIGIISWCARVITDPFRGSGGRCPACGKQIKAGQFVCHHCGRDKRLAA